MLECSGWLCVLLFLVVSSDLVVDFARCLVSIRFDDWGCVLICRVLVVAAMGLVCCLRRLFSLCLIFWLVVFGILVVV